jgi:hypothetical protein
LSITFARKTLPDRKVWWCVSVRFRFGRCRDFPASTRNGNSIYRGRNGWLTPHRQRGRQSAHEGRHAGVVPRTGTRTRSALPIGRPASVGSAAEFTKACSLGDGSVSGGQWPCALSNQTGLRFPPGSCMCPRPSRSLPTYAGRDEHRSQRLLSAVVVWPDNNRCNVACHAAKPYVARMSARCRRH